MSTRRDYEKEAIAELVPVITKAGYRVFIAEQGNYGFFTDSDGTRIVSFAASGLAGPTASGNYKTSKPQQTGTGWRITDSFLPKTSHDIEEIFKAYPPQWALRCDSWSYTTLEQYLDTYQRSSKYEEVAA